MKRKKFIQLIAGGIGLSAIPGIWFLRKDARESAIRIITSELSYLKLDPRGIETFTDDYLKKHTDTLFVNGVKAMDMLGMPADRLGYTHYLVKDYLLSSTFFKNKMDENQVVHYSGTIYNPYTTPCGNPFSFIYFSNDDTITAA